MQTQNDIPVGYCQCGCGRATKRTRYAEPKGGLAAGEYRRFVQGHATVKPERDRYAVDKQTGCWIWQGAVNSRGYGMIDSRTPDVRPRKRSLAHRVFYERHVGPIPSGMVIDHLCSTPRCVNPEHLEAVTPNENWRRGKQTKLTFQQAFEIKNSSARIVDLASQYGVSKGCINGIRSGRSWKDVPVVRPSR